MTTSHLELSDLRALLPWVAEQEATPHRDTAAFKATMQRLKDARLGALRLPRERGGAGITLVQLFDFIIDLAAADPNVAHAFRNPLNFVEGLLIDRARVPVYETFIERVARGETFGASATELGKRNVGNFDYETAVTHGPDGLRLNGRKFYSTGNLYADHIHVYAVDAQGKPVKVVVPATRAGVHIADDWDGFGQQFTASGTTTYTDVRVTPDEIIDNENVTKLPYVATFAQLYLSAVVAGVLQRVVKDAALLLKSRERNFYHAVAEVPGDDPLLLSVIGRLESVAHLARVGVLEATHWLERGFASAAAGDVSSHAFEQAAASTAKTKVVIDDLAIRAAGELFEVGGASSTRIGKRLDRHWRALRTVTAHNPLIYKALAIGRQATHDTPLPNLSFF
ncbi:acyl-CoA dehydrogenase [Caballeronia sp. LZ035]|uniref:acyl-CoA dehydrogenase n=1 Tax=Caballeronia sp. LZ035 TaxID=3038568 RepID=UPI00285F8FBD|nr:acyl-CoA dehydrogenase [Caballeronia sp. LZ035]MDR5759705.1 acyl-CoA dehydrogenase [Caballeronia sp. LZ035]